MKESRDGYVCSRMRKYNLYFQFAQVPVFVFNLFNGKARFVYIIFQAHYNFIKYRHLNF